MIELQSVKNYDKVLNNLEMACDNLLFIIEIDKISNHELERFRKNVHFLITESIRIIKEIEK